MEEVVEGGVLLPLALFEVGRQVHLSSVQSSLVTCRAFSQAAYHTAGYDGISL